MTDVTTLRELVVDGSVDTVVLAFPDIQGRPVGKRVTGSFFLDHAGEHGIEVCDYLLAVDVDMNPLPGYRFTNWDTGYGDLVAVPDFSTTRVLPWLDGTALVICDLLDPAGRPVEVSPAAHPAATDRAGPPARGSPCGAPPSSSSSCSWTPSSRPPTRAGVGWPPTPAPSRTTSSSRRRARSTSCAASATRWSGPASRSSRPRARPAAASTRSTSRTPRRSRRPTATSSSRTA